MIAGKFEIGRTEALIIQEKLWNNPTLAIGEVNLWANGTSEVLPPLVGNYGQKQQISVELEQLIETAGKRRKRVAIKQLEQKTSQFEFEELLRELKKELRQNFYHLANLSSEQSRLSTLVHLFTQLKEQYQRQVQLQNIAKVDYYRIQSELVALKKELFDLEEEAAETVKNIRILTQLDDLTITDLDFSSVDKSLYKEIPSDVLQLALTQNIGLQKQHVQMDIANKELELEKAMRKPDLTFQLGYDRGGNIMRDFIGVGLSVDLPIFNRNKGNIKAAQLQIEKEDATDKLLQGELKNTVIRLENQLTKYKETLEGWPVETEKEQQEMVERYKKHLQSGQVTLMEFIDFTQASREAHKAFLDTWENYNSTYEELQYLVGKDF